MSKPPIQIGRYALCDELARGGMATVHLGRLLGPVGFARTVAIKRLHPHLATDPAFVAMLLDEARLAARIQHPNVAATIDVVAKDGELFVVMEYLHGETLSRILRAAQARGQRVPPNIAVAILVNALTGLHAAHEAVRETGEPLGLVHRDVSPQNIMVRRDGTAVVVDFGVAKAAGRFQVTEEGLIKGKLPYMAAEQLRGQAFTRRVDVYAASAVLWETLVGERLVKGASEGEVLEKLLFDTFPSPSSLVEGIPAALDAVVMKGLARKADDRWATAREMALALEDALPPATPTRVATWLEDLVGEGLREREKRVAAIESGMTHAANPAVETGGATPSSIPSDLTRVDVPMAAPAPTPRPSIDSSLSTTNVVAAKSVVGQAPISVLPMGTAMLAADTEPVSADSAGPRSADLARAPAMDSNPSRPSRTWIVAVAVGSMSAVAAVVAFTSRSAATSNDRDPVAAPTVSVTATASVVPPASDAPVTSAAPPASAAPPPEPTATAPVVASSAPRPAPPAAKRVPVARPSQRDTCKVPYVEDATGKRIYKRECL